MSKRINSKLSQSGQPSRREFVVAGIGVTAAGLAAIAAMDAAAAEDTKLLLEINKVSRVVLVPGQTVLFQGDSITDAGRKRDVHDANSQVALGNGYAWLAASQLLVDRPDDGLKFFNRGISGNKVFQLAERW